MLDFPPISARATSPVEFSSNFLWPVFGSAVGLLTTAAWSGFLAAAATRARLGKNRVFFRVWLILGKEGERVLCMRFSLYAISYRPARMLVLALSLLLPASLQVAAAEESRSYLVDKICSLIESSASTNRLPVDFFTRLIWQESRLNPDVIGAATRNGRRAEGIAQFMPATAAEHKLIEPFNPVEALPKSGEFLAQLRNQFGNLGLAAAAYNAGPKRVQDYLSGIRALPMETRKYVLAVTGKPVQAWAKPVTQQQNPTNVSDPNSEALNLNCQDLVARLEQQESRASNIGNPGLLERQASKASNLEKLSAQLNRNGPSWCSGLRHPNVSECGDVHMPSAPAKSNVVLGPPIRVPFPRTRRHLTMASFH